jgi:flagellar FliL protein
MATAAPKAVRTTDKVAESPTSSKKKFLLIGLAAFVLLGACGAGAWFYFNQKPTTADLAKPAPPVAPVFVPLETFTVNLQGEDNDQYLQTQFTLQVADSAQADAIKLFMPQIRSRLLTLLSSKKAEELKTPEGKKKLAEEIMAQARLPFSPNSAPQKVSDVFFTSFVIQ